MIKPRVVRGHRKGDIIPKNVLELDSMVEYGQNGGSLEVSPEHRRLPPGFTPLSHADASERNSSCNFFVGD
jgi:hypothetical protein